MLPLTGRRVLVTRAPEQASALAQALQREGAEVLSVPAIAIAPPGSYCGLDAAITTLRTYDWVVFTSANAAAAFAARARRLALPAFARRLAVIGPATARAVLAEGIAAQVDLQPERFVAESLVEALAPRVAGASVLVVRAEEGREVLVDGLKLAGAEVTVVAAYRTVIPMDSVTSLRQAFADQVTAPDTVTLTSGSSALNLHALLQAGRLSLPATTVLASIGPVTSQTIVECGWRVSVEAPEARLDSLVSSLVTYFGGKSNSGWS